MGQFHNEFRGGNIGRGIVEALGAAGYDVAIERVGETVTPIIDIWSLAEWAIGRQEFLGAAEHSLAGGGAGFRTIIGIRNVSTESDPWIVTVEPGTSALTNGGAGLAAITFTDSTDVKPLTIREGRSRINPPMMRIRAQNNAALPSGISAGQFLREASPAGFIQLRQPVILRFGQSLYFYSDTDNVVQNFQVYARSRRLLPGERTGAA